MTTALYDTQTTAPLEVLMKDLCILLQQVLGQPAEREVAGQITALVSELSGIRTVMERHSRALEQAALTLKEAQPGTGQQILMGQELQALSQDIAWIKAQLSQDAFAP
ncbi:hypothetical protein [Sulfitobacter dubius]|uniref:hypothetical protein n=1 Tax=Sulfitobacter dubius TaxID=218673 RepID=UPI0022AF5EF1|nr:hypothetical protein [Sulfitobacter dubius]MCZ4368499.1 hypothetical protein [Sulfitobacter dubius]|tara:strand:- start:125 stop:448 length:324 start_codon:yes stop_codon:yes gene_type:complete